MTSNSCHNSFKIAVVHNKGRDTLTPLPFVGQGIPPCDNEQPISNQFPNVCSYLYGRSLVFHVTFLILASKIESHHPVSKPSLSISKGIGDGVKVSNDRARRGITQSCGHGNGSTAEPFWLQLFIFSANVLNISMFYKTAISSLKSKKEIDLLPKAPNLISHIILHKVVAHFELN